MKAIILKTFTNSFNSELEKGSIWELSIYRSNKKSFVCFTSYKSDYDRLLDLEEFKNNLRLKLFRLEE